MDLEQVVYSTQPVTLQQRIWLEQAGTGSFEPLYYLIVARTNIEAEHALKLLDDDLVVIIAKISEGMQRAFVLASLAKVMDNA